jgi:hypothetical protein
MAAGIPPEDIVFGFHPADVRPLTRFAVGYRPIRNTDATAKTTPAALFEAQE